MKVDKDENGWTVIDLDQLDSYETAEDTETEVAAEDETEEDSDSEEVELVDADEPEDKVKPAKDKKGVERGSRAQERIRQLVAKEKAARDALAAKEAELIQLREAAMAQRKESATTQQTLIKNQIEAVEGALRRAHEENDYDEIVKLQRKLNGLEVDRRIVDAQASRPDPVKRTPEVAAQDASPAEDTLDSLPEEMQYWVRDNMWAVAPKTSDDRARVRAVRRISRELASEGYQETEADFFDELDARLEKAFGSEGVDGVEYNKDTRTPSPSDVNKRKPSPVSTASRTPASRRTRIALSPEERLMAERLGLDPKQYALRKKAREDSNDTWTTIL